MLKVSDFKDKLIYSATEIVPAFERAGETKLAKRIADCGDYIRVATCQNCHTRHYAGANHCTVKYCPVCAKMRSMLWLAKLLPFFNDWLDEGNFVFKMNFTIQDTASLKDGLRVLTESWRYMTNGNKNSRKDWKQRFCGGVRSLEVKTGKNSGLWHPHFHCIVLKDHYSKDYDAVRAAWEHSTQVIAGTTEKIGSVWLKGFDYTDADDGELIQAVIEVFKYITNLKFKDAPGEQINELVKQLHGRKAIQSWGLLYNMADKVEKELEDMTHEQLKDYICSQCGFTEFEFETILCADFIRDEDVKDLIKSKK